MRKYWLVETEENKKISRKKAKEGMVVLRREGPIREYRERTKRHLWTVKWRKFLSQNPMYRELKKKIGLLQFCSKTALRRSKTF